MNFSLCCTKALYTTGKQGVVQKIVLGPLTITDVNSWSAFDSSPPEDGIHLSTRRVFILGCTSLVPASLCILDCHVAIKDVSKPLDCVMVLGCKFDYWPKPYSCLTWKKMGVLSFNYYKRNSKPTDLLISDNFIVKYLLVVRLQSRRISDARWSK